MTGERRKQLDDIVRLCTEIENAAENADWDEAGQLLLRRQRLVESVFSEPPATTVEVQELTSMAERLMAFDAELMPLADAARGATAEELKRLRRSREVAEVYKQNSG